jgi:hypothetical protein
MSDRDSFQLAKPGILGEVIYPVAPVLNLAVMGDDLIVDPLPGALIAGIAFVIRLCGAIRPCNSRH